MIYNQMIVISELEIADDMQLTSCIYIILTLCMMYLHVIAYIWLAPWSNPQNISYYVAFLVTQYVVIVNYIGLDFGLLEGLHLGFLIIVLKYEKPGSKFCTSVWESMLTFWAWFYNSCSVKI